LGSLLDADDEGMEGGEDEMSEGALGDQDEQNIS